MKIDYKFKYISDGQMSRFRELEKKMRVLFGDVELVDIVDSDKNESLTFELEDGRRIQLSASDCRCDGAKLDINVI